MKNINKELIENELWKVDDQLFKKMDNHYQSENERKFFETMREKMMTELAPCKELLISEKDNEDEVYLLRDQYDEFILGQGFIPNRKPEIHTMNLCGILQVNLKDCNFLTDNITFWEWLRRRDYKEIMFDHNYAYL